MSRDTFIDRFNVDALTKERKDELVKFLIQAILDKRVFLRNRELDDRLGNFVGNAVKLQAGINTLQVKRHVLLLAHSTWKALKEQKRRFFIVTTVTDTGVYGIAADVRP